MTITLKNTMIRDHHEVIIGAVGTAVTEAAARLESANGYPHWLSISIGLSTLMFMILKIIGWCIDRFVKKKRRPRQDED